MTDFVAAGIHGLRNLLRLSGRDSRSQFWFYMLWLMIAQQLLSGVAVGVLMVTDFGSLAGTRPPSVAAPSAVSPDHLAFFGTVMSLIVGSVVLVVALLAAAVVRRLHDSDLRGWWGMMPLPFLLFTMMAMASLTSSLEHFSPRLFGAMFVANLIYLIALVVLIVLLCRPSTDGANRFGERSF